MILHACRLQTTFMMQNHVPMNKTPTFYLFRNLVMRQFLLIGLINFTSKAISILSIYFLDLVTDSIREYNPDDRSTIGLPILYLSLMTLVYLLG